MVYQVKGVMLNYYCLPYSLKDSIKWNYFENPLTNLNVYKYILFVLMFMFTGSFDRFGIDCNSTNRKHLLKGKLSIFDAIFLTLLIDLVNIYFLSNSKS